MLNNKRFVDTFAMTTPLTSHIEKQFKQTIVEVIVFFAQSVFAQNFNRHQLIQILACCLTGHFQFISNKINLGIGMTKNIVDEVLAVDFGLFVSQAVFAQYHPNSAVLVNDVLS